MTADRIARAHATEVFLLGRIHELLVWRSWYRAHRWADWPDLRKENETELRALLAVARGGRCLARRMVERADPVTAAKSAAELNPYPEPPVGWQENELAAAWGR